MQIDPPDPSDWWRLMNDDPNDGPRALSTAGLLGLAVLAVLAVAVWGVVR